jgi:nucleoside-diphosphate-sugar epimerase
MEALGWTASTRLLEGIEQTYPWIDEQVNGKRARDDG